MMKLGGSLTRQDEREMQFDDAHPHIANIGLMIEVTHLCPHKWLTGLFAGDGK